MVYIEHLIGLYRTPLFMQSIKIATHRDDTSIGNVEYKRYVEVTVEQRVSARSRQSDTQEHD